MDPIAVQSRVPFSSAFSIVGYYIRHGSLSRVDRLDLRGDADSNSMAT